jgi:hypothetical protein
MSKTQQIKSQERWKHLLASTPPGCRLLLREAAEALGMTNTESMRHYTSGRLSLPQGFKIVRVGPTVLLERTQDENQSYPDWRDP